jgi:membrane protease YdiL (CAAX protease family)
VANAAVGKPWAHHAAGILGGLLAGALFLFGAIDYASGGSTSGTHNSTAVDFGIMATAAAAAAVTSRPVRGWAARFIPIDPDNPVHALALALTVILFGTQAVSIAFTDVLASEQQAPALSIGDLLAQELPFLVLALAGVGIWMRRGLFQSGSRLGLVAPAWWHAALALAAAGIFFAISQGADSLSHALTPTTAHQVDVTTQHLFGGLTDTPGLIALAVIPGICEETLFRGALQPRLGILVTAVLFTSIHAEYGLSIDVPTIFLIALGLGFIRKYTNTTATVTSHVTYNLLVGFGLTGLVLYGAIAVEVVLVAIVALTLWRRRRRPAAPEPATQGSGVG